MVTSLLELSSSTIVRFLREHLHSCQDVCKRDTCCVLLASIGWLPNRLLSLVKHKMELDLLDYEPECTLFYFSNYAEFLSISRSASFCLERNCPCESTGLKLSKLRDRFSYTTSKCDCSFCLSKDLCKRYWNFPRIHERIFMYVTFFAPTLTSLHVSFLCSDFIDSLQLFVNLKCLHVHPATKMETSAFKDLLDDLIRGLQCCKGLRELRLVCNFLYPTTVCYRSIAVIRKLSKLEDLYLDMENITPKVAAYLIHHLKHLKKFGLCNWIGSSPLKEVYSMLKYRYDYESWPKRLVWTAPVNVDDTPADLFDDVRCDINLLKVHRTCKSEIPKLGYIEMEGDFERWQRIFQSGPIMADTVLFMETYGHSLTSVNLILRNSTVKSGHIVDVIAMCQHLERLFISVGNVVHQGAGDLMQMRVWNPKLKEFEFSAPKGSEVAIVGILAMVLGSCPKLEHVRLFFKPYDFTQHDITNMFDHGPTNLKSFLLDNGSNHGIEPVLANHLLETCPLLEKMGYIYSLRPGCSFQDCDICMAPVIINHPRIKFLKCSERKRFNFSTARWNPVV